MPRLFVAAMLGWIGFACDQAQGGFTLTHTGANDPLSEGFVTAGGGAATTGPLTNDLPPGASVGTPSWMIRADSSSTQYGYATPEFTASQKADVLQGFELTVIARVIQGTAAAYDSTHTVVGGLAVNVGSRRFDMYFGVNSRGQTLVTLADSLSAPPLVANGDFALVPGSIAFSQGYRTYTLAYDATTQSASLSVDGTELLTGYMGQTQFTSGARLTFIASSGGQVNYNLVQLKVGQPTDPASVPAPPTAVLAAIGGIGLLGRAGLRRARHGRDAS